MRRWGSREITRHHSGHSWVFECLTCGAKVASDLEDQVLREVGEHVCRRVPVH